MRTSRRGLTQILVAAAILAAGMIGNPASAQKKGGNKPPPPPNIPRPICFWGDAQKPNEGALWRVDLQGTSMISVTSGITSYQWPRWSPNGLFIGCYFKF